MAKPTRTLTVNFVGRTDQLDKAYKRVNKGSQNMSATLTRGLRTGMTAFAGIGAAAAGFVALTKPMVDIAADVGESMSKNRVLFGEASESVAEFAKTASKNFGLSNRDALEAAGNFGALTHAMGMSGEEGAQMSLELVKLAADMASFNNADPSETLTALAAGLRGENEPLRRFGILLDAATLKTKALEMGLIENTKSALDPATKALAAYEAIMEQSTIQQGDFERTSDGLANKQRQLAADWTNLQEQIGLALLPLFEQITTVLVDDAIPNLQKFIDVAKDEGFFIALDKAGDAIARWQLGNWDEILGLGGSFFTELIDDISFLGDSINNVFVGLGNSFANMWNETNWKPIWEQDFSVAMGWLNSAWDAASDIWDKIFGGDTPSGPDEFGPAQVGGLPLITGAIDEFGPAQIGGLPLTTGAIDELGPPTPAATLETGAIDEFGPAKIDPVFTPEELDFFEKAVAAGFFGTQGGPGARGEDLNLASLGTHAAGMMATNTASPAHVTVNINGVVSGSEAIQALGEAVNNEGMTFPGRWVN